MKYTLSVLTSIVVFLCSTDIGAQENGLVDYINSIDCRPICGSKLCCVAYTNVTFMAKTCDVSDVSSDTLEKVISSKGAEAVTRMCDTSAESRANALGDASIQTLMPLEETIKALNKKSSGISCEFCCTKGACGICCTFAQVPSAAEEFWKAVGIPTIGTAPE